VQHGDTLWDITGYYFQNPWRWPAVWGHNPQITNPHWIFPGDQVRLVDHAEVRIAAAPSPRLDGRANVPVGRPRVPRGTVFLREEAWAAPEDINASGSIYGAPEDNMMLAAARPTSARPTPSTKTVRPRAARTATRGAWCACSAPW
jgi:hypothetical protein